MNDDLQDLLNNRLAASTIKGYDSSLQLWFAYAKAEKFEPFPASSLQTANFLASLANRSESVAKVNNAAAAIADLHKRHFLPSPTNHDSVKALLAAVKRNHGKPVNRRTPMSTDILSALNADLYKDKNASLQKWRTVWRMNVAFYALLRWSEVSKLRWSDLSFHEGKMRIRIRRSKTDQCADGATVTVADNDNKAECPVRLTQLFYRKLGYSTQEEERDEAGMQPRIRSTDKGTRAIAGTTVSYTTATEDMKACLSDIGVDPNGFGEHSARRGGATAAANGGVNWLDLKRHGRWKSDKAAQTYVDAARDSSKEAAAVLARTASVSSVSSRGSGSRAASPDSDPEFRLPKRRKYMDRVDSSTEESVASERSATAEESSKKSGRRASSKDSLKTFIDKSSGQVRSGDKLKKKTHEPKKYRDEIQYEAFLDRRRRQSQFRKRY